MTIEPLPDHFATAAPATALCVPLAELRRQRRAAAVEMAESGMTHDQIGRRLGVSRVAITRMLARAGVEQRRGQQRGLPRIACASQLGTRRRPLDLDSL
jgi:hypothetical protein